MDDSDETNLEKVTAWLEQRDLDLAAIAAVTGLSTYKLQSFLNSQAPSKYLEDVLYIRGIPLTWRQTIPHILSVFGGASFTDNILPGTLRMYGVPLFLATISLTLALACYGAAAALFFLPVKAMERYENKVAKRAQLKGSTLTWADFGDRNDATELLNFLGLALMNSEGRRKVSRLASSGAVRGFDGGHYPAIDTEILASGQRYRVSLENEAEKISDEYELLAQL